MGLLRQIDEAPPDSGEVWSTGSHQVFSQRRLTEDPWGWLAPGFRWTKTGALLPHSATVSLPRSLVGGSTGREFFRASVVESHSPHRTRNPCDRVDPTILIQHQGMRSLFQHCGDVSVEIRQRVQQRW